MQASARHLAILAVEFDEPTLQPQKHVKDLSILVIHEARAKCGSSKIHPRLSACARQLSFCRGWTCARHELCSAITEIFISQGQISQKSSFTNAPSSVLLCATVLYRTNKQPCTTIMRSRKGTAMMLHPFLWGLDKQGCHTSSLSTVHCQACSGTLPQVQAFNVRTARCRGSTK